MQKQVVVVGSINLDLVGRVARIPTPGETITGHDFQYFHGGKGANQAVAVARLNYPVSMIGKVGNDVFGPRLRKGLQSAGVNVKWVTTASRASSGVALITADRQGQNSIVVIPGANGRLVPGDLKKASSILESAGILLAQLEIPVETVEYLAALARKRCIPLMLDPAPARDLPRKVLQSATYLTPNETETCILCRCQPRRMDLKSAGKFAQDLRRRGAQNVIIKMGSHGVYVLGDEVEAESLPAFKVRAVDSTAAGDAFNAGLAVALMRGSHMLEAARYASAVGALSVTSRGAQSSMPTARQVSRFLKRWDDRE
jgi:ribokinase